MYPSRKNKRLSLKSNFVYTVIGNLTFALSQWLIITIIAKLGTPSMVGSYTLGLAITAPIFLFFNMNLRTVQATDVNGEYKFVDYFYNRNISNLLGTFSIFLILLFIDVKEETKYIIVILTIYKMIESLSDVSFGLFQQQERMDFIALSKIYQGIFTVIVFGITMNLWNSLLVSATLNCIVLLLIFLIHNVKEVNRISNFNLFKEVLKAKNNFNLSIQKTLIITCFPLGVAASLDSLNVNMPRYFVQYFQGEEFVGYFSAIFYIMSAGGTVITAIAHSTTPRLADLYHNNIRGMLLLLRKLIVFAIVIGFVAVISSILFGKDILTILYGEKYSEFNVLLVLIMISASMWFISSFIGTALLATRKFNSQLIIHIITLFASLMCSIIFVPEHGVNGAGLAIVFGHLTRLIVTVIIFRKIVG